MQRGNFDDIDEKDDEGKICNGHGEEIQNPDAYFQAVDEDRYGYQEQAAEKEKEIDKAVDKAVEIYENQQLADDDARGKGFGNHQDMMNWVNEADDLNEQYDRADSVGAPEPPYVNDPDGESGGNNRDDGGDDW